MTPALIWFFPRTATTIHGALPHHRRHPTRPISRCPAKDTTTWPSVPIIPSRRNYLDASSANVPNLGQLRPHRLPRTPLRVVELCGGLATGLEALHRTGYVSRSYALVDTDPDAHTIASQRITYLRRKFPHILPPEAVQDLDSRLPMDVCTTSP